VCGSPAREIRARRDAEWGGSLQTPQPGPAAPVGSSDPVPGISKSRAYADSASAHVHTRHLSSHAPHSSASRVVGARSPIGAGGAAGSEILMSPVSPQLEQICWARGASAIAKLTKSFSFGEGHSKSRSAGFRTGRQGLCRPLRVPGGPPLLSARGTARTRCRTVSRSFSARRRPGSSCASGETAPIA